LYKFEGVELFEIIDKIEIDKLVLNASFLIESSLSLLRISFEYFALFETFDDKTKLASKLLRTLRL
jgi:hypothetical protein